MMLEHKKYVFDDASCDMFRFESIASTLGAGRSCGYICRLRRTDLPETGRHFLAVISCQPSHGEIIYDRVVQHFSSSLVPRIVFPLDPSTKKPLLALVFEN
jgi:hypothetical protein